MIVRMQRLHGPQGGKLTDTHQAGEAHKRFVRVSVPKAKIRLFFFKQPQHKTTLTPSSSQTFAAPTQPACSRQTFLSLSFQTSLCKACLFSSHLELMKLKMITHTLSG